MSQLNFEEIAVHDVENRENLQAEVDIRMGETRGQNTIIEVPTMEIVQDSSSVITHMEPSNDDTMVDSIFQAVHKIIDWFWGGKGLRGGFVPEPHDLDNLCLFQGNNVEEFVMEMRSPTFDVNLYEEICATLRTLLQDENHAEWERRCKSLLRPTTLNSTLIKELETWRGRLRAYLGTWSQGTVHCSPNIYLLDDQLTAHRIPFVNQTDSIRGKLGFDRGVHAWDIRITGPTGTHCSVGIATKAAQLWTKTGYVSIIGDDEHSWGWDIVWGNLSHRGKTLGKYPEGLVYHYTPGDSIRIILDCDRGILSYAVNEMDFGIAYKNLPEKNTFFPSVGLVYGNIEVSLVYLGMPPPLRN